MQVETDASTWRGPTVSVERGTFSRGAANFFVAEPTHSVSDGCFLSVDGPKETFEVYQRASGAGTAHWRRLGELSIDFTATPARLTTSVMPPGPTTARRLAAPRSGLLSSYIDRQRGGKDYQISPLVTSYDGADTTGCCFTDHTGG